jgi:energy-coupling factor transporter ATP-binding protein EcfA2
VSGLWGRDDAATRQRADELLELFELTGWKDTLVESYSHGMRQKLLISSALVHSPDVIVVDEPMVGLDPKAARLIKDVLRTFAEQGGTVFLSTHTLEVAEALCDRIAILHEGRIRAAGTMAGTARGGRGGRGGPRGDLPEADRQRGREGADRVDPVAGRHARGRVVGRARERGDGAAVRAGAAGTEVACGTAARGRGAAAWRGRWSWARRPGLLRDRVRDRVPHPRPFQGDAGRGRRPARRKLLGMILLAFLSILLLSNIITALSSFFLARDLELLAAAPVDSVRLYAARFIETAINSSWMMVLVLLPILLAFGVAYGPNVAFVLVTAVALLSFLVLPAVVGTALTQVLVNVFPARRARDLLALIACSARRL